MDIDITEAQLSHYFDFLKFHEFCNRNMKTSMASLEYFKTEVFECMEEEDRRKKISKIIESSSWPWGNEEYNRYDSNSIEESIVFLSTNTLIRITSSFEHFITTVIADISRWLDTAKIKNQVNKEIELGDNLKLLKIYEMYQWDTTNVEELFPYISFFQLIRNSIAHRNGNASFKIRKMYEEKEVESLWGNWPFLKNGKSLPPPPQIRDNKIIFLPTNVLFAADLFLKVAADISVKSVNMLGVEGLIYISVYNALLSDEVITKSNYTKPQAMIMDFLHKKVKLRPESGDILASYLSKKSLWKDCLKKFDKLSELLT